MKWLTRPLCEKEKGVRLKKIAKPISEARIRTARRARRSDSISSRFAGGVATRGSDTVKI